MRFFVLYIILMVTLGSCQIKPAPSQEEISKKILLEYVCAENARVDGLKIIKENETQSLLGLPALQLTVSGEIEWVNGCDETFAALPKGYKESFSNKTVMLVKSDKGWQ